MTTNKSFFQKYGPAALGRGLWGNRPMPTKYKLLFIGQSVIFTLAMFFRTQDVERVQAIKKLEEADKERAEIVANAAVKAAASREDVDKK